MARTTTAEQRFGGRTFRFSTAQCTSNWSRTASSLCEKEKKTLILPPVCFAERRVAICGEVFEWVPFAVCRISGSVSVRLARVFLSDLLDPVCRLQAVRRTSDTVIVPVACSNPLATDYTQTRSGSLAPIFTRGRTPLVTTLRNKYLDMSQVEGESASLVLQVQ